MFDHTEWVKQPIESIDVLSVSGKAPANRHKFRVWKRVASDVEGCYVLRNPRPLGHDLSLRNRNAPISALTDALQNAGYEPKPLRITHKPGGRLIYDSKKYSIPYLRCVLAKKVLFGNIELMA